MVGPGVAAHRGAGAFEEANERSAEKAAAARFMLIGNAVTVQVCTTRIGIGADLLPPLLASSTTSPSAPTARTNVHFGAGKPHEASDRGLLYAVSQHVHMLETHAPSAAQHAHQRQYLSAW